MDRNIYLDNAATTELCQAARQVILDNLDEYYNVNSVYEPARKLRVKVEQARENIAELIGAKSADEVYFTSGGSEANSWVTHQGLMLASNIEHSSVKSNYNYKVDSNGIVDLDSFKYQLDNLKKIYWYNYPFEVISLQAINNELGVIQQIKEVAEIAHQHGSLFHTDAVQMLPHMRVNVQNIGCDMMSGSSHKFNGPKSVGFAYFKNGIKIHPLIKGGAQERGVRGGTTNAVNIIAMAAALEDTYKNLDEINSRIAYLSGILQENLLNIDGVSINCKDKNTPNIPAIFSVKINGVRGADVVTLSGEYGIMISSGSACHEGSAEPSRVLKALGMTDWEALSCIRISLGRYNTKKEIQYASDVLYNIIKRLRSFKR